MKLLTRIILVTCILGTLLAVAVLPVAAAPDGEVKTVYDHANLFTAEQEAELTALADGYHEQIGDRHIVVVTTREWDSSAEEEAGKLGFTSRSDSVYLLAIFVSPYQANAYDYQPYSLGDMSRFISDERFREIELDYFLFDEVKQKDDAFAGSKRFITLAGEEALQIPARRTARIWMIVGVSIVAGLVVGGVAVFLVWRSYRRKSRSASYPLEDFTRLTLAVERDIFLGKSVIRTRIPRSNGGGRGGGGGGGGFSRGGGGGRSGGRH